MREKIEPKASHGVSLGTLGLSSEPNWRRKAKAEAMPEKIQELEGMNILVAEDDNVVAVDHTSYLQSSGAGIVGPFKTAREATDALKAAVIDVALIDFLLEDQNSAELQQALERKGIPFVVVTGYPAVLVRRGPHQTVLHKPVSRSELTSALQAVCKEKPGRGY